MTDDFAVMCQGCGTFQLPHENNCWKCRQPLRESSSAIPAEAKGGSLERSVKPLLPCADPCPKCGSTDIYRRHRVPGKMELGYSDKNTQRINEYVHIDGWLNASVKKECISHHCRTCQYGWETGVVA